jgi:hypothetical protein
MSERIEHSSYAGLARMLHTHVEVDWTQADLEAMFAHQLGMPAVDAFIAEGLLDTTTPRNAVTIAELLEDAKPDLTLLTAAKLFGKVNWKAESTGIVEVRRVIYFAAIAAAEVNRGVSITALSARERRAGYKWALGLPWISQNIRDLLTKAMGEES